MSPYKPFYQDSHALIAAVDHYQDQRFAPLNTAVKGARALERLLKRFRFKTTLLVDDEVTTTSVLNWFGSQRKNPDDRLIFYFAGHGFVRPIGEDKYIGYLAVSDTRQGDYGSALRVDYLFDEAHLASPKHTLLLLDACFGGVAVTRSGMVNPSSLRDDAERLLSAPFRYVVAAGDCATDDSQGPEREYSTFTAYLLRGLQGDAPTSAGMIGATQLAHYIEDNVHRTRFIHHRPRHGHLEGSGAGDMLFDLREVEKADDIFARCTINDADGLLSRDEVEHHALLQFFREASEITVLDRITTGQSGSSVFLVDAESLLENGPDGLHFCKIYRSPTETEQNAYKEVANTKMGDYVPRVTDSTPVIDGWMARLYQPAHATRRGRTQALSDLLESNARAARDNVMLLVNMIKEWNTPLERSDLPPNELLKLPLRRYQPIEVAERLADFFEGLSSRQETLQFSDRTLPNPAAYLMRPELWEGQRRIRFPVGHVHGDLHTGNVICLSSPDSAKPDNDPVIIDFDTYEANSLIFYDFAYLEIDICIRMIDPAEIENRRAWLPTSAYLAHNPELGSLPPLDPNVAPLNVILRPIRQAVLEIADDRPTDYEYAYWIARVAAGLNFARKRKVSQAQRLLALLLAAQSLDRVLDLLGIPLKVENAPYWMNWLDSGVRQAPFLDDLE